MKVTKTIYLLEKGFMLKMLNYEMLNATNYVPAPQKNGFKDMLIHCPDVEAGTHAFPTGARCSRDLPYVGIFFPEASNRPFSWGWARGC